jgi:hypothetical protein
VALPLVAGDHQPGGHAAADLQGHVQLPLQLAVERGHLPAQLEGGPHRAQRVVLVGAGDAVHGHDGVADELLDHPAVALVHAPGRLEVAGHGAAERLGVEQLAQRGGAGDVGEHHRDGLADLVHAAAPRFPGGRCDCAAEMKSVLGSLRY